MLRVESSTKLEGFTEFEEDILFDADDPDFGGSVPNNLTSVPIMLKVRRNISSSLNNPHTSEISSTYSSSTTLSHNSNENIAESINDHILTIEELRLQITSCFSCGVSWSDRHVSLDCAECGGYALERPCPTCNGLCGNVWVRDLTMSHASSKAHWEGKCTSKYNDEEGTCSISTCIQQELSSEMEKLSTHS